MPQGDLQPLRKAKLGGLRSARGEGTPGCAAGAALPMPPAEVPAFAPLREVGLALEESEGAYRVTALGRQKL